MHAPLSPRRLPRAALLCVVCAGTVGCASTVVADAAGSGSGSSGIGVGVGGSGGSAVGTGAAPVECSGTYGQVSDAIVTAQGCDPAANVIQCSGAAMVHDLCGCSVVANETNMQAIAAADAAYAMCASEGCCGPAAHPITPPPCDPKCPPMAAGGHCDPATSLCVAGP